MKINTIIFQFCIGCIFAILCACNTSSTHRQGNFKILSYNILEGLQNDSIVQDQYIGWVKKINPDIIAYQEMNKFTQKSIEAFAARYQHNYAVISKVEGYPTALSSKYPIVNVQKVVDNMWHAYIYANINGIHVFVIHFSPHQLGKRRAEVKQLLAHAALIPKNEKIVILGDFNSISGDDAAAYGNEYLEQRVKNEAQNAHIRNLDNGQLDFSVIQALKDAGYVDAFRLFHQDFKASVSTKKYGSKNSRIDFAWLNPELAKYVVSTDIIYDDDTDTMSDHYPLLIEFCF